MMKTTITPRQALEQITSGHLSRLIGLDPHDLTHVLDDAKEVILLTYHQKVRRLLQPSSNALRHHAQ